MAKYLNSVQQLALTHISILAGGAAKEADILWLASKMTDWLTDWLPRL